MNYYNEIKEELVNNEAYKMVKDYSKNRSDLKTYYNVGKLLNDAGKKYGEEIISQYSKKLTSGLGRGYSKRNLWLMLRFYILNRKMQTVSAQLSWSHYCKLISLKINYYINLDNLEDFLKELGIGYSFIGTEYPIKLGDRYNYIDILLYNVNHNCYVVVELKIGEIKKEHIGQVQTYMNYIDKNLRTINQNDTIGIIICKKGNSFIMQYVTNKNIYERE